MRPNFDLTPLKLSEIPFHHIQLRDGERRAIVCPDCMEWHPLRRGVIWPHHLERTERGSNGARCAGSARRVVFDVDVAEWQQTMAEASASVASRRATKVLPKPKTTQAPAASQTRSPAISAEAIRQTFRQHQKQCAACNGEATTRGGEPLSCRDGERLAATFLRLLRQEPKRRAVREFFAQERRRFDRRYIAAAPAKRASEWAAVLPAVQAMDTQRVQLPVGDAANDGASVPQTTLHPAR